MNHHVHVSAMATLVFALQLIIVGFILRTIAVHFAETKLGKAIAYVY